MRSSAFQTMPWLCPPFHDLIYDYPQGKPGDDEHDCHCFAPSVLYSL